MKKIGICLFATLLLCIGFISSIFACTDFRIMAKDGTVVIGRSMEFALDLKSNLRSASRGRVFNEAAMNNKQGLTWKTKYGYLYLDAVGIDTVVDGMNEAGLSFEALYLPGEAQYQVVPSGHEKQGLSYVDLGHWILGNFKTVDEVRNALPHLFVYEQKIPTAMGDMVFPLHFAMYDSTGKGIVAEYVGGKLSIYDNKIGVMTNSPTYDWHITNLRNYINLKPTNPNPVIANGITFVATGQGAGMVGLPGDISPPSRFVKTAILLDVALPVSNATEAVNLAEHVINNVDIPSGLAREPQSGNISAETTQWVVFKDLTHKMFYYRTYNNMTLRSIDLDKVDFAEKAPQLKMPIEAEPFILDLTSQFTGQKID